jgi:hypothetical protein
MTEKEIPKDYQWANALKPGDIVFVSGRGPGLSKSKVTKVTKTQIVVGDHDCRYSRYTLSRRIDSWSSDDLLEATPEHIASYNRQVSISNIHALSRDLQNRILTRTNVDKLTDGQLQTLRINMQSIIQQVEGWIKP